MANKVSIQSLVEWLRQMDEATFDQVEPAAPVHRRGESPGLRAARRQPACYSRPFDTCIVYSPEQGRCGEIQLRFNSEYGKPK